MYVDCEDCDSVLLVSIKTPRFDTTTSAEIRDALRENIREDRDVYLFDLSKVSYIDSTGIGTLIGFVKYLGRSRRVELCGVSPMVRKVFRLTNLLSIFTIHYDINEGLTAHRALRHAANG